MWISEAPSEDRAVPSRDAPLEVLHRSAQPGLQLPDSGRLSHPRAPLALVFPGPGSPQSSQSSRFCSLGAHNLWKLLATDSSSSKQRSSQVLQPGIKKSRTAHGLLKGRFPQTHKLQGRGHLCTPRLKLAYVALARWLLPRMAFEPSPSPAKTRFPQIPAPPGLELCTDVGSGHQQSRSSSSSGSCCSRCRSRSSSSSSSKARPQAPGSFLLLEWFCWFFRVGGGGGGWGGGGGGGMLTFTQTQK